VALDASGNIIVTDYYCSQACVQIFDSQGTFLLEFGSYGRGDGQFDGPWGVAVGATGNIFVTDAGNNRIQVFAPGP
jgi:DNA-binding beta-propeller fold protein YncE